MRLLWLACPLFALLPVIGGMALADDAVQNAPAVPVPAVATAPAAPAMLDIPVLSAPKQINEQITADDLIIKQFPIEKIRGDILQDSNNIIGLAAKRVLNAGQPLRTIDLRKTFLVQRGDQVTMVYKNGDMEISASGKSLDSGALHDSVKVSNIGSNRTVDAVVTGPKQVEIRE